MTPFIEGHFARLDRETDRKSRWQDWREPFLTGLAAAWEDPDRLAVRYAQLPPDKYAAEAMFRVLTALPDLQDIDAFFAAVCLGSVGLWSGNLDRARPAADLVSCGAGGPALPRLLAQAVLTGTQAHEAQPGRQPVGLLEEIRDFGLHIMRHKGATVVYLADRYKLNARQMRRSLAGWADI
ncbi:hypothetical protein PH7735_00808 [Shimia thalassica]|uniref:Uncharacterized protein n=1 Tax=Shimia thalassica TaxID=1715693 RepID=A0A0P1IED6_9RHOB|nr:hypothetical protein [Shimia thalassica]CUJ87722.1 hypothetical protein PH7735_00808 [Shimia thalassica]